MSELLPRNIKTIALVANLDKPSVPSIANDLIKWMNKRGVEVVMSEADALKLDNPDLGADDIEIRGSDFVICLGGDGTILRAIRLLKGAEVPLVGVNMGRVGFLSEVELADMYPSMERIIAGDYTIDERMMLKCTVKAADYEQEYIALNEVAIERGHHHRMLEIDVYINETLFSRYTSDGLIFATPTGSTAYSFSAGGPVVSPANKLILLAPINPHSLFGRTLVLSAEDKARIELTKNLEIMVGIDGFTVIEAVVDYVNIERAESRALLAKLKERSFYNLFKDKLRVWDTWLR